MVSNNKFPKTLPINNRQLHIEETIFLEKYICLKLIGFLETKIWKWIFENEGTRGLPIVLAAAKTEASLHDKDHKDIRFVADNESMQIKALTLKALKEPMAEEAGQAIRKQGAGKAEEVLTMERPSQIPEKRSGVNEGLAKQVRQISVEIEKEFRDFLGSQNDNKEMDKMKTDEMKQAIDKSSGSAEEKSSGQVMDREERGIFDFIQEVKNDVGSFKENENEKDTVPDEKTAPSDEEMITGKTGGQTSEEQGTSMGTEREKSDSCGKVEEVESTDISKENPAMESVKDVSMTDLTSLSGVAAASAEGSVEKTQDIGKDVSGKPPSEQFGDVQTASLNKQASGTTDRDGVESSAKEIAASKGESKASDGAGMVSNVVAEAGKAEEKGNDNVVSPSKEEAATEQRTKNTEVGGATGTACVKLDETDTKASDDKDTSVVTEKKVEETKSYFKLGMEGSYVMYENQYNSNSLASSKHDHQAERDKRRSLGNKFRLYDFKWLGEVYQGTALVVNTLRSTMLTFESSIPTAFLHPMWHKQLPMWIKAVRMCKEVPEFAAMLTVLQRAIKPLIVLNVWRESLGHVSLKRMQAEGKNKKSIRGIRDRDLLDEEVDDDENGIIRPKGMFSFSRVTASSDLLPSYT